MLYREFPPSHPALKPHIRFFWTLTARAPLGPQIVVPDGCPELVFHFGGRYLLNGESQPREFVFGQIERAICIEPGEAFSDILGVRFQPAGLAAFTRVPQHELRGRMVTCQELWGGAPRFGEGNRIPALQTFLLSRLREPETSWRDASVSGRQYRRRFLDAVGLTPKRFERIQRLQRAMTALGRGTLADAALAAGYFDQAHFTRDFREFTGQTPAQYLRGQHELSDLFLGDVRNVQDSAATRG